MKYLFFTFLISTNLFALDFKEGEYELLSGDESICEDGLLKIKEKDLTLGSRYIFLNFNQSTYDYQSDDKSCTYKIINHHTNDSYTQSLLQDCKIKNDNLKREIHFTYNSNNELKMKITKDKNTSVCILKFIK
jgi:hypothetical protein